MNLRLCALSIAAVCVLVAGGCGGGASSSAIQADPISFQELAQSASTSADATSGRFSFDMAMTLPGAEEPFSFAGEGAFDAPSKRASFAVDMSALAKMLGGFASALGGGSAGGLPDFDDPDGWKIEAIQDGDVAYIRFPAIDGQLPEGKTWIKATKGDAHVSGFDVKELESFTRRDPRELLDTLRSVSGDIETVGTEELRGVETTHYRAVVDPVELAKSASTGGPSATDALLGQLTTQSGIDDVPLDVWIDANGLVRKLSMEVSATEQASEAGAATISFELWDYGETVEIDLPPASQVADASALHG
jgi:hypothetical protein